MSRSSLDGLRRILFISSSSIVKLIREELINHFGFDDVHAYVRAILTIPDHDFVGEMEVAGENSGDISTVSGVPIPPRASFKIHAYNCRHNL